MSDLSIAFNDSSTFYPSRELPAIPPSLYPDTKKRALVAMNHARYSGPVYSHVDASKLQSPIFTFYNPINKIIGISNQASCVFKTSYFIIKAQEIERPSITAIFKGTLTIIDAKSKLTHTFPINIYGTGSRASNDCFTVTTRLNQLPLIFLSKKLQ